MIRIKSDKIIVGEKTVNGFIYIDGENMKTALGNFYSILYSVEPTSIGGAIPDAGIYYLP